jgi:hypothetical protein
MSNDRAPNPRNGCRVQRMEPDSAGCLGVVDCCQVIWTAARSFAGGDDPRCTIACAAVVPIPFDVKMIA